MNDLIYEIAASIDDYGIQLFAISALFCLYLQKRRFFPLRLAGSFAAFVCVTNHLHSVFTACGLDIFAHWDIWTFGNINIAYALIYLMVSLCMWFCFEEKYTLLLYMASGAYVVQHLAHQIDNTLSPYITPLTTELQRCLLQLGFVAFVALIVFYFFIYRKKRSDYYPEDKVRIFFVIVSVLITAVASNWIYNTGLRNVGSNVYAIFCCVLLLYIQFSINHHEEEKQQWRTMEGMLLEKSHQMEEFKTNIDVINLKCHDLKKQIDVLQTLGTPEERNAAAREIRRSIRMYDSSYHTGNEALDTVLTQKSLQCQASGITLSCIADGSSLDFISATDVYSLFSNLLDNAVDALQKEAPENRQIRLQVVRKNDFISILMENICTTPLQFHNGIPVTTNEDRRNHGYGTLSIRYLIEKYHGNVQLSQKDELFSVKAVIPIPSN